jgi:DNA polymerase-3 subunit delta
VSGVHLLRGGDPSLVGEAVVELVHRLVGDGDRALVVDTFDGDGDGVAMAADAARTAPFLTDSRVVVIRNFDEAAVEDVAPLVAYLADPSPTTDLVLEYVGERVPKSVLDAVKAAGGIVTDIGARTAKDRRDWLDERLAAAPVRLDAGACAAVAEWLGEDLGRLTSLFETLEAMHGTGARLGADDVEPFLGAAGSVPPWDLTDALDRSDTRASLEMLARMTAGGARHPLQLMAILHGHYGRMLRLDGAGVIDGAGAAAVLNTRQAFQAKKALDQARRLGHTGIVRAFELLAQADLDLRGDKDWPPELVMEVLVARLSRLAPAARPAPARR